MRTIRWLVILALVGSFGQAQAHWTEQPELPDWAQRGKLYWCLHYATHTRPLADLFLEHGQTLVHGGSFDSPETAEYARSRGLRYMPYVCSRTTTIQEIAKYPQLKDAVLLKADRSEFLAYNNPVRRYGCLFAPAWFDFVCDRTRKVMDKPDAAAIFYDNVYVNDDHNPRAVAAWGQWAAGHGVDAGEDMPALRDSGPQAAAGRIFNAEALIEYYAGLRVFNRKHEPPLLISPNLGSLSGYGPAIMEAGAVDLVFYETMSHPPFENNAYRYKLGLAASHGRPTGILAYLPEKIGAQRSVRTWHEGMHHFFYPSSPIAEEFSLAAAEAAACGGTYIPAYNIFPSLPITDLTDPFDQRIHRAIKQSYAFIRALEPVYASAQPGSNVAVFHSTATQIQDRRAQNAEGLAKALIAAGIPFEVVVAADLTGDGTRGLDTLIVPNAIYMDEPTAAGILRFAQNGGRVVLNGAFASLDPMGRPAAFDAAKKLTEPLRLVARPLSEWSLDGFEPEGTLFRVKGLEGRASLTFSGPPGRYAAYIQMLDENDGTSPFSLAVGGKTVFEGKLDFEDERPHWFTSPAFDLAPGDRVELVVRPQGGERGRTQAIVLSAVDSATGAAVGRGQVIFSPTSLEGRQSADLVALLQPKVRLPQPGKVFVNVLDVRAKSLRTVHLVNYDFRYEVAQEGLYATDDGEQNARTYIASPQTVAQKRIHIERPGDVVEPVLQVYGYATPNCKADLLVILNDRRAGTIQNEGGKNRGWMELPLDRTLLAQDNVIEFRAEGALDNDRWWQIGIDTDTRAGNSQFSTDGSKTFTSDDLSPDLKAQVGEYMVRIVDRRPGASTDDSANRIRNPHFEQERTPHSETKLTVAPAERVEVAVAGDRAQECLALSSEAAPVWLTGEKRGDNVIYAVPKVAIYTTLLLADSRAPLEPLQQALTLAAPWSIPPVTAPLRKVPADWERFGSGFVADAERPHAGKTAMRCENAAPTGASGLMQQVDLQQTTLLPVVITAWSRAENVSGKADSNYAIFVNATCDDGSVMNGLNASFAVGTHGWEQATLRISPKAPIRVLQLYLMFRRHSGRVWFDDVSLTVE